MLVKGPLVNLSTIHPKTNIKIKSHKILHAHAFFCRWILLKLCTEHDNPTVVLCAKSQRDSTNIMDVTDAWDFTKLQLKMNFGLIVSIITRPCFHSHFLGWYNNTLSGAVSGEQVTATTFSFSVRVWSIFDRYLVDTWSIPNRLMTEQSLYGPSWYCMMTSSNGNIFRVTGPLRGEFNGHRWIPHSKASDAELKCFLWSALE